MENLEVKFSKKVYGNICNRSDHIMDDNDESAEFEKELEEILSEEE